MNSSNSHAHGPTVLPEENLGQAATQAAWRFLNNDNVSLQALAEPLQKAGGRACERSESEFVLLAHDWCKLDYGSHTSKKDVRQVSHQTDLGYDLTTSLLIDAVTGSPLAPMQVQLKTADQMHCTAQQPLTPDFHHLEQIKPMMQEADSWDLSCRPVHVIDREADSLGHFRQWMPEDHLFLVRCDDRRVLLDEESILISEIITRLSGAGEFEETGLVEMHGEPVTKLVAEVPIVLHGRHKTLQDGKQKQISGAPLPVRLVVVPLVDESGAVVAEWTLLTNVPDSIDAAEIGQWYYWRWRIESFFKLLKTHGLQAENWQQQTGAAIARRLLVAVMTCVQIWKLRGDQSAQAERFKSLLIKLSGRQMKYGTTETAPALLAGYFVYLSMSQLLEQESDALEELKQMSDELMTIDTS